MISPFAEPCHIPNSLRKTMSRCVNKYSITGEDTKSYSYGWHAVSSNDTQLTENEMLNAYQYTSEQELETIPFWGHFNYYSGGGYVANLGNSEIEAVERINVLRDNDWIDENTRAVHAEFNVWNANTNLFNMVIILFEYHETGFIRSTYSIDIIELYRYSGPGGLLSLLSEILLTIFVIVKTIAVILNIVKSKEKYLMNTWNIATIFVLGIIYVAFALYIWRSILTASTVEKMMNNRGMNMPNLTRFSINVKYMTKFKRLNNASDVKVFCMSNTILYSIITPTILPVYLLVITLM